MPLPVFIVCSEGGSIDRREEKDAGGEFEFKTIVQIPGMEEPVNVGEGRFVFKTAVHRLIATLHHEMPSQSGNLLVAHSVRRIGETDWISQEYVIPVERIESSANQMDLPLTDNP